MQQILQRVTWHRVAYSVALFIVAVLSFVFHDLVGQYVVIPKQFKPTVNSHPQYRISINITGDYHLINQLSPRLRVTYQTNNSVCAVAGDENGRFINTPRKSEVSRKIVIGGSNTYLFYLDKFEPGFCNWQVASVALERRNVWHKSQTVTIALFDASRAVAVEQRSSASWLCDSAKLARCRFVINQPFEFAEPTQQLPLANYDYFLAIRRAKTHDYHQ